MSLKHKAFAAIRWTAATAVLRALLQVVQVAALTRILVPADYGLLAVVSATLAFAQHFTDFGLNSALVQRQTVTDDQRCSLYWTNVLLSLALAGVIVAIAPVLAWWLGDPRLLPLVALSAVIIVVQSTATQLRMQAEKELHFRPVVLIELVSMMVAVSASIAMAYQGLGALSMVLGSLLAALFNSGLTWVKLRRGWIPRLRLKFADVKPFVRFGGQLVANNVVNQINAVADIFIGNRLLGATQMGLFAVPRNLMLQVQDAINPIVTRIGFPMIAQAQHETAQVAKIYLHTLRMTSSVNAPIYLFIFAFAPDILSILLGQAWHGASSVLRVLALWGVVRSTANPVGSLLTGMGRADLSLRWNVALLVVTPACLFVAASFGVTGLAAALLALQVVWFVPAWYFLVRPTCGAPMGSYANAALTPMCLAAAAAGFAMLGTSIVSGAWLRCCVGAAVFAGAYIALSVRWNREWLRAMLELANLPLLALRLDRGAKDRSASLIRPGSDR
jgi:O-antigen/teichoic acid export membrane protein